jgi:hypothetical protein
MTGVVFVGIDLLLDSVLGIGMSLEAVLFGFDVLEQRLSTGQVTYYFCLRALFHTFIKTTYL